MNTTKISHIAHLVEIIVQHGISKVVISPGSRNAPLIIALDSHPKIEVFLVHDERSAAFFSLGLAEESKTPVAITCTSGSAPVNYSPAISEAYYRNIPLLVLTADRPVELVDQGDGQTIRQKNLFQNFIKASFELPNFPKTVAEKEKSDTIVNHAMHTILDLPRGPVHINIPLAEPLYETQNLQTIPIIIAVESTPKKLTKTDKEIIKKDWIKTKKKLLLIGQLTADTIRLLKPLTNDPSIAILVENTANVKDFQRICHCIDRTLAIINEDELKEFAPELLITMGGAIISKKIKTFFRNNKPKENWRIGTYSFEEDTYQSLTHSFSCNVNDFLSFIGEFDIVPNSNFGSKWKQRDFLAQNKHEEFLKNSTFSDLKAYEIILDALPSDSNLHMSNSSVVRYCQLFNPIYGVDYYSNRGVSGIDGSTSTALGISIISNKKLNLLITGDISFFYDSNALWNNYLPSNLRIIVINNGGGGIFKIIDGPNKSKQSNYFYAPFKAKIEAICDAFDVHYLYVNSIQSLENSFQDFYKSKSNERPVLLEIDTQNIENENILKDYFARISN